MFKQASNRYQRSKGFKVKHAFQIALLAAVSVWLLYQVKHSHDKRHAYDEKQTGAQIEGNAERVGEWNANGLGRKGKLEAFDEGTTSTIVNAEKNEENVEEEEEIKDLHTSSEENEHQDQGVGDDEIDRHEEERIEEQESQEENENITDKTENDEGGKVADAEEEEQSGDVGAKFVQIIKQETDDNEETSETKDDHNENKEETSETKDDHNENKEETSEIKDEKHDLEEDKIAKEQSENEHHEGEGDENVEKQNENEQREGEEDKKAEKQSENEHHEGEEDKNAQKQSENKHHEGEEDKNAQKQSENEQHEGEEVKNAEKKNENEHHEGEEVKNAEKKIENEHREGEEGKNTENVEKKLTESRLVPIIVHKENKTAAASPPEGDDHEKISVDPLKTEESGAVNNETVAVDGIKDVAFADSNAQKEAEKLEGKNQEVNITTIVSYSDSNAETEHERLEENRKAVKESEAEDHELEQSLTGNHETVAETHKELDELATSESKNETENTSQTKLEDVKLDSSLDGATLSNEKKPNDAEGFQKSERSEQNLASDDETSFKTDDASEETLTLASSESNSTTESEHPDGGDATSQDIPGENEAGNRTDLETLPESETVGQNSEEISVQ